MLVLVLVLAACSQGGEARVADEKVVGPRMRDLTIESPALGGQARVRLLLPDAFEEDLDRRWPVLYLLHGCCDTYRSWTDYTDVEELTAGTDLLVVMPDGGMAGFYSDWHNGGQGGPPQWETFHLVELRTLLEESYRAGDRRAVAGVSMGGLGALGYAARHPGMFAAAASFSGIVGTRADGGTLVRGVLTGEGEDPEALWGDPVDQAEVWAEHDPHDLAGRLDGVELFLSVGDAGPGPLDPPGGPDDLALQIERDLRARNLALRDRLEELGIPVRFSTYPGNHAWPYWGRELARTLPGLLQALGEGGL